MTTTATETDLERAERMHQIALLAYNNCLKGLGGEYGVLRMSLLRAEQRLARAQAGAK